jgi:hypothetical protein
MLVLVAVVSYSGSISMLGMADTCRVLNNEWKLLSEALD